MIGEGEAFDCGRATPQGVGKLTMSKGFLMTYTHPAPSQPRIPPPSTPHHVSFAKNRVSFAIKPTKEYHFHDGEPPTGDHVHLGLFVRPLSPRIAPPSRGQKPPKITQQKDARIRVLFNDRFYHVFQDVAKRAPDHHFHVGERRRGRVSDSKMQGVSDGEADPVQTMIPSKTRPPT